MPKRTSCKRKTCPDIARAGHEYCTAVCRHVDIQVNVALKKGDKASMGELSALLGVVDAINLWRTVALAENRAARTTDST